jgi:hypothetical protein
MGETSVTGHDAGLVSHRGTILKKMAEPSDPAINPPKIQIMKDFFYKSSVWFISLLIMILFSCCFHKAKIGLNCIK